MKTFIYIAVVVILGAALGWSAWYFGLVERFTNSGAVAPAPSEQTPTTQTATSTALGAVISYPSNYSLNSTYSYTSFGPQKPISGLSLTIPSSMATGTNLASDTYVSVEQLPRAKNCTGDIFILDNVKTSTVVESGTTYSVATTSGAAAGNRFEETVYAISGSKPCTAVRYFVHYGTIENYPAGEVREFDRAALLGSFDTIRRTLSLIGQ